MAGIVDAMLPASDAILSIRDNIGAIIHIVSFVTRTWSGVEVGQGTAKDVVVQMKPTPGIKSYDQDIRLKEGGSIKAGDIILKSVSRHLFKETDLDGSSPAQNIEKFFLVGAKLYQVISLTESYVTWNVQLRELTNQARY
jgi:hypothetical protein